MMKPTRTPLPRYGRQCLHLTFVAAALAGGSWAEAQPFGFTSTELQMFRLDLAGGSTEEMPGVGGAYGLAYAPNGVLYGVFESPPGAGLLATLEPPTGQFEVVGTMPGIDGFAGGLTFDAQGRLWLARLDGDIYEVDPATAEVTLIAESLLEPGYFLAGLTACDDRLIALAVLTTFPSSGRLVIIDPALGTATPLGPTSTDLSTLTGAGGLDFDAEGRLWAVLDRIGVIDDPLPIDALAEIDPVTGTVLSSQTVQTVGWSLAISPPPAVCPFGGPSVIEVPTLGPVPLALLATLLALAGGWMLRRRALRPARLERAR